MSASVRGSCLCGGIEFEITGPLMSPLNCHCSQCRKQHGAASAPRALKVDDFRWLQGEDRIKFYETSRGYLRGFCRNCGSPVINKNGPNWKSPAECRRRGCAAIGLPLALLDNPAVRPACHTFADSKAACTTSPTTPQYPGYPPA